MLLSLLGKSKPEGDMVAKAKTSGSPDQVGSQVTSKSTRLGSRLTPTQAPTSSHGEGPSDRGVPDTSELHADEEEIEINNEWSQYSATQLAQVIPSLKGGLPRFPKLSLLFLRFRFPTFFHQSNEELEDVYIVLRPINFKHSSQEMLQRIGEITDMAELQRYLLFQHWGVKVGKHFYHLHIVEEDREDGSEMKRQRLAVSLSELENITLKIPIWQTGKSHEECVMNAIAIIRMMGGFKKDDEVEVYGDHSGLKEQPLPVEERQKYRRTGPRTKLLIPMLATGEYNAALNNCINFSMRYLIHHIFDINPMTISPKAFRKRMLWVANKWISSGCKLKKEKLMDLFTSPLGLLNPMRTLTRTSDGNILLVRMALVFIGKIQPEGVAFIKGAPSGMSVIKESNVKAAAPQVEKEADAEIGKLKK
ncbi:hypothetical protein BDQ17DRAFT_278286 [Cyathus striatus]|nr:hypothetical protein BDQ17DRAFT_278286 [Cyathus striatus]